MIKQSFGELLREIRRNRRITMRTLASSADMDPAYLSRIENGKTGAPKRETVERLAQALCEEQLLEQGECDELTRQLLVSAGHLQGRKELIDDLSDRFSSRLRDEGFPEENIDEALAKVPLATMRKVLLGEEKLEIGYQAEFPPEEVKARKDAGEDVLTFGLLSPRPVGSLEKPLPGIEESATGYLHQHAEEFTTQRRQQRARSSKDPRKIYRAGPSAEIRVNRPISKEQEHQLRLITKLITTILEEKNL